MGTNLQITSGPALERAGDLASILSKLEDGDVLFIDEIHRLPRPVEEVLYPAMEDFRIDVVLGKGPAARSIPLDLARFTLVGATTRTGLIPARCVIASVCRRLDYYEVDDLQSIAMRGRHPRGRHRRSRRLRDRPLFARPVDRQPVIAPGADYAEVERDGHLGRSQYDGLSFFGVDELGLDKASRRCSIPCAGVSGAARRSVDPRHLRGEPTGRSRTSMSPTSSSRAC